MGKKKEKHLVKRVAIFGFAGALPESELYKDVYKAAKYLAEQGYGIVDGGGPGVMEAATNGAEAVSGETLTVTLEPKYAPGFEERYYGNVADVEIKTGNYIERIFTLMAESDFFVIFNGGTGTLSEFGLAWCLARLYNGHHKGFVLYGDFWHEVVDVLKKNMLIRPGADEAFEIVNSPEGIVRAIKKYEDQMMGKDDDFPDAGEEGAFMVGGRGKAELEVIPE